MEEVTQAFQVPNLVNALLALVAVSMVPFLAMMATSFVKITVILSLIRNALGVQQSPPNMALHGLAMILTIYIMAPVVLEALDIAKAEDITFDQVTTFDGSATKLFEPYREFLKTHTRSVERDFFVDYMQTVWPEKYQNVFAEDSFIVLVPAFSASQLRSAFEVGFLVYVPFLVIDLIVANILLALGMMMLSPLTISLPFKLLLFVLLDGWSTLIFGLVNSY